MNMYKCLSAIMHLGNVDFSENDDEQSSVRTRPKLQVVAVSENDHCTGSSSAWPAFPGCCNCFMSIFDNLRGVTSNQFGTTLLTLATPSQKHPVVTILDVAKICSWGFCGSPPDTSV